MISETEKREPNSITITSRSADETRELGRRIGSLLTAGSVLALIGELGSGKTVFIQGVAQGLDIPDEYYITSPTYTLINEYPGRFTLYHVDLYRISEPAEYEGIGLYEIFESEGVVAVEWANMLSKDMPGNHITVEIQIHGDHLRKILISAWGQDENDLIKRAMIKPGETI